MVRLFKTRAPASAARRAGDVLCRGQEVKPAWAVRVRETLTVQHGLAVRALVVRFFWD